MVKNEVSLIENGLSHIKKPDGMQMNE